MKTLKVGVFVAFGLICAAAGSAALKAEINQLAEKVANSRLDLAPQNGLAAQRKIASSGEFACLPVHDSAANTAHLHETLSTNCNMEKPFSVTELPKGHGAVFCCTMK